MTNKSEKGRKMSGGSSRSFEKDPLTDKIGSNLKQLYNDVLSEDVPSDFLSLLEKADKQK